jgi:hypothetical protein
MKTYWLKEVFMTAGVVGFMAAIADAAPQGATNNGKTVAPTSSPVTPLFPTNAVATPMVAASAPQPYAPIGGAFTPALMGRTFYLNPTNPVALGGLFGVTPLGGNWYPGPIGGTMSGEMPPGGRLSHVIVGGNFAPASPLGGTLNGRPTGGQFGTHVLGGIRSPNYSSFTAGSNGVIVGGAPQAGVSPGGVLVGNSSVGGALATGTPPGGVMVGGAPPLTNTPGGHLQ